MIRQTGIWIGLLLLLLGAQRVAHAVSCGNTVTGTVILTTPLVCPTGHGLAVGNGATLDCNGQTITGGNQSGQYGIYVRSVSNAVVRNCTVAHFEVGIRLRGAIDALVEDNVSRDNTRYGLEITLNSTGAVIQRNDIIQNGDEGIHVSGPPDRDALHEIIGNIIDGNGLEGIYLLDSDANTVADNAIQNQGTAGIYIKGSHRNTIEGNILTNDPLQLVNGSQLNVLSANTLYGQRIKFDGAPNNTVYTMSIQGQGGTPSIAYDFTNAPNNTLVDSAASNPVDYHIKALNNSKNIVFTRFVAVPTLRCVVDQTSGVRVTDPNGTALPCPK
jgi:parallel beta-helix repeat protein